MTGLRISAEQVALRWRPALRQAGVFETQRFTTQVRQYLLYHQRAFDASDDFHALMEGWETSCGVCNEACPTRCT